MNTLQIDSFLEAAECKSFSTAAENLFISQPTLSRNIAKLENDLGMKLFERGTFQKVELTEAGQIMKECFLKTKEMLNSSIEAAQIAAKLKPIKMTLGLLVGQLLDNDLSEMLSLFKETHQNVKIDIKRDSYNNLIEGLKTGKLDLACMPEWQFVDRENIFVEKVGDTNTVLVIPKSIIPCMENREYSLLEFKDHTFISVDNNDSAPVNELLMESCGALGFAPKIMYVASIEEQIFAIEMGEGIFGINPYNSICYSPNVHCVKIKEFKPQTFAIAWRESSKSEGIKLFSSFVKEWRKNHR